MVFSERYIVIDDKWMVFGEQPRIKTFSVICNFFFRCRRPPTLRTPSRRLRPRHDDPANVPAAAGPAGLHPLTGAPEPAGRGAGPRRGRAEERPAGGGDAGRAPGQPPTGRGGGGAPGCQTGRGVPACQGGPEAGGATADRHGEQAALPACNAALQPHQLQDGHRREAETPPEDAAGRCSLWSIL